MDNDKLLREIQNLNKTLTDMFIFQLCAQGYSYDQVRKVVGKVSNGKIADIRNGLTSIKK
jgi:hypothetical protein